MLLWEGCAIFNFSELIGCVLEFVYDVDGIYKAGKAWLVDTMLLTSG